MVGYLAELFHIKQMFTSGCHSQTNVLTERFNRTITTEFAKTVNSDKNDWPIWLQGKMFVHDTTEQKSTGYGPFEV